MVSRLVPFSLMRPRSLFCTESCMKMGDEEVADWPNKVTIDKLLKPSELYYKI
jgi:hypothetical protein